MTNEEYFKWLAATPGALAIQEATLANRELLAKHESGQKTTTQDLKNWWTSVYGMWQQNPAEFQKWAAQDPNMATRWYAWAQNDGQNLTRNGQRVTARELQAENMAILQSAGVDLKNDGKLYTTNFNTVSDVNNNWGVGDFWKLGTYNSADGGVVDTVKNIAESPTALAGIALMVAMPYIAPQLASALMSATGMSAAAANTAAASILSAGSQAVRGGDLSQIVTAGVTAALPGLAEMHMPAILNSISPEVSTAYQSLVAQAPATVEEGQRVWDNLPTIGDIRGVIDPNIPQGDQPTGVKYDMPILNPVVATPSPTGASGGSSAPPQGTSAPPATPVPPTAPNAPQSPTGPSGAVTEGPHRSNPVFYEVVGGKVYTKNPQSGQWEEISRDRLPKGSLQTDGSYDDSGRPITKEESNKEFGGLDLGYLIWAATQGAQQGQNQGNGGLVLGPGGPTGPGGQTGTPGSPTGTPNGTGTNPNGTSNTPGNTPGPGSGPGPGTGQNGDGTGDDTPPGPDFDWTKLIPLLALVPPDENKDRAPVGRAQPQDMSTLYQKPTYGPVEQKGLLEPYGTRYTRQAPSVLPAENSNQGNFQQWYLDWLRGQNPEQGLLPQVSPSTRGLV